MIFPGPITAGLAVDIFLALSGWLIGGILINTSTRDLPRFFFNRATRIWIPYAFAILLVYGLALAKEGFSVNWLKYLFYDVTFTHYNFTVFPRASAELPLGGTGNHFWSLSIEEQFYLLAPIVMLTVAFGKKPWLWLLLAAAMLALGMRAAPIALGVAAAAALKEHGAWHTGRIGRPLILAGTVLLFAAMWRYDVLPLRGLFAAGMVLSLATVGPRMRLGLFAGAVSYPLYLNHWGGDYVMHALQKVVGIFPTGIGIAIAYLCAVAIGVTTWALVDRWVMAHRAGWFTRARGRALGACAYALVTVGIVGGLVIRLYGG
jgi:peptidoglycan/LPS O-acetylase OafA/YrhL